jgi:uncharacterized protein YkwD
MARALLALVTLLVAGGTASAYPVDSPTAGRQPASEARHAARAERVSALAPLEKELVSAVNHERARHGLAPLRVSRQLAAVARVHSLSMAEHGFFAHEAYDGAAFWLRIKNVYPALRGRTWAAGENLAWASPELTADNTVEMWLGSPQHRQNMLAARWREIGIGSVRAAGAPGVYDGLDVTIVTADFGAR